MISILSTQKSHISADHTCFPNISTRERHELLNMALMLYLLSEKIIFYEV